MQERVVPRRLPDWSLSLAVGEKHEQLSNGRSKGQIENPRDPPSRAQGVRHRILHHRGRWLLVLRSSAHMKGGVAKRKETSVSDVTLKYPLWQNHYLQAMAETHPELLKSRISAAEQVVSLRLRQLVSTTDDYEEQIALAAAQKSLKVLKER